jgi:hypothetical protein
MSELNVANSSTAGFRDRSSLSLLNSWDLTNQEPRLAVDTISSC